MKALIVSADMFEDSELLIPYYRLLEEKIETDIASIKAGTIIGKHGYKVVAALSLNQIDPSSYDLVILPGGKAPSALRINEKMLLPLSGNSLKKAKRLPPSVMVLRSLFQLESSQEEKPRVTKVWRKN